MPLKLSGMRIPKKRKLTEDGPDAKRRKLENNPPKKLLLILDIDHTFLHASRNPQAYQVLENEKFSKTVHKFFLSGSKAPYFVKLRPGFDKFLKEVSRYYDIHVYTMGVRRYAEKVISLFDNAETPTIKQLVARDDYPEDPYHKTLNRLFQVDEKKTVILDDRIDVWANPRRVLHIYKYTFWPESEDRSGKHLFGQIVIHLERHRTLEVETKLRADLPKFLEDLRVVKIVFPTSRIVEVRTVDTPHEKRLARLSKRLNQEEGIACRCDYKVNFKELARRDGDEVLTCVERVLKDIYKLSLVTKSINTIKLLSQVKAKTFKGLRFVFSGIIPKNEIQWESAIWIKAEEFGAKCYETISEDNLEGITHVIAERAGTDKVIRGLKLNVFIVHINWFWNSVVHFLRSNEEFYCLPGLHHVNQRSGQNYEPEPVETGFDFPDPVSNTTPQKTPTKSNLKNSNEPSPSKTVRFSGQDQVKTIENRLTPKKQKLNQIKKPAILIKKRQPPPPPDFSFLEDSDEEMEENEKISADNNNNQKNLHSENLINSIDGDENLINTIDDDVNDNQKKEEENSSPKKEEEDVEMKEPNVNKNNDLDTSVTTNSNKKIPLPSFTTTNSTNIPSSSLTEKNEGENIVTTTANDNYSIDFDPIPNEEGENLHAVYKVSDFSGSLDDFDFDDEIDEDDEEEEEEEETKDGQQQQEQKENGEESIEKIEKKDEEKNINNTDKGSDEKKNENEINVDQLLENAINVEQLLKREANEAEGEMFDDLAEIENLEKMPSDNKDLENTNMNEEKETPSDMMLEPMSPPINKKKGLWMDELDEETRNQMKLSIITLLEDENEDEITEEIVKQTSENFDLNRENVIEFCKRFIDSGISTELNDEQMESPVLFPIEPPSDSPATNKLLNDLHKLHKESVSKNNTPVGEELMGQSNLTKQDSKNDDDDFDLTEIDKLIEEENKKIQEKSDNLNDGSDQESENQDLDGDSAMEIDLTKPRVEKPQEMEESEDEAEDNMDLFTAATEILAEHGQEFKFSGFNKDLEEDQEDDEEDEYEEIEEPSAPKMTIGKRKISKVVKKPSRFTLTAEIKKQNNDAEESEEEEEHNMKKDKKFKKKSSSYLPHLHDENEFEENDDFNYGIFEGQRDSSDEEGDGDGFNFNIFNAAAASSSSKAKNKKNNRNSSSTSSSSKSNENSTTDEMDPYGYFYGSGTLIPKKKRWG